MSVSLPRGILTLSIDLEHDLAKPGLAEQRSLEEITVRLLNLMGQYDMPATWAVADPAMSAATERITSLGAGHEIAILGDATWVGTEAGRSRFARELTRRVVRGRSAGLAISTLALKTSQLEDHSTLAMKQGISAVRHLRCDPAAKSGRRLTPHTLRFGLWGFPVSLSLPGTSRWLPGGGGAHTARRGMNQAVSECGLFQLVIDAPQLAARGHQAERVLERILQHARRLRGRGVLDIATLGATATKLASHYRGKPSHSILHVAA